MNTTMKAGELEVQEPAMTAADERELDGHAASADDVEELADEAMLPVGGDIPEWAVIPPGMKLPEGRQITFLQFRAAWTDRPGKGDRQCILWNLTEADEKLALKRTRGDAIRTIDELSKQMIRVIDGQRTDWTGARSPASAVVFWEEIGGKLRQQIKNLYVKTHSLTVEESVDFFTNCIAVRTVGS